MMNQLLSLAVIAQFKLKMQFPLADGQKKGAMIEIKARINPISYEKPTIKRMALGFSLFCIDFF